MVALLLRRVRREFSACRGAMAAMSIAAIAMCLCGSGCDTPSFGSHMTSRQIVEIGAEGAVQIESQYLAAPDTDSGMATFNQVAARISPHARALPDYVTLRFAVVESSEELAMSLPDGHIFISSGLLARMANDPDEIACVLAHEIGHVALGHDIDNLGSALGDSTVADMLTQGQYQNLVNTELELSHLSYSKYQEDAADEYAVRVVEASGYDATALLRFVTAEFSQSRGQSQVYWSDTHPVSKKRIARIEQDVRSLAR
jgi:predicted Zn-dependent protease